MGYTQGFLFIFALFYKNVRLTKRPSMSDNLDFYFRAACSVNCVIFGLSENKIKILLGRRPNDPFKGEMALPGTLVYPNDSIEDSVDDIIRTSTGNSRFYKKQIRAFADTSRHPLGRVISIGYYSFVDLLNSKPGQDTGDIEEIAWYDLKSVPKLAFDHNEIVEAAHRRLLAKMSSQLAGFELLPEKFTLKQFQELYEASLGHELDKRNFRRKVLSQDVIMETGEYLSPWEESGKAPLLYMLDRKKFERMKAEGHKFEIF